MDGQELYLLLHNPVVKSRDNKYCGLGSLIYAATQLEVNGSLSNNRCKKLFRDCITEMRIKVMFYWK